MIKKTIFLCLLFIAAKTNSQVYPYDEGFTGIPSLTLPAGWQGDMKVRSGHGLNDDKCIAADISGTDFVDSAITPWIGPLDNNTEFYFWYRMVEDFIYPSTQKNLTTDNFTISISTDSVNYLEIFRVDSNNHQPNTNFKKITFPITNYGGQVVKFKLRCEFGYGSSYYVDVDSIKVRLNLNPGINEANKPDVKIYPSISSSYFQIETNRNDFTSILITNFSGQIMISEVFQNRRTVDVSNWNAGVYFVQLQSPLAVLSRKITIQR